MKFNPCESDLDLKNIGKDVLGQKLGNNSNPGNAGKGLTLVQL